jgi:hypothetical protein
MRKVSEVGEKIKTQIYFYLFKKMFPKLCRLWENVEKILQNRTVHKGLRRMRTACWITKAKIQKHTQNI